MEPVGLPYLSGLMSDITLGVFLALCGFGAACALLVGAWRAVKLARRWKRRRAILARLRPPQGEAHWEALWNRAMDRGDRLYDLLQEERAKHHGTALPCA